MFIQVPLRIDVRGELLPVARQDVFAPRDAIVEELKVDHGTEVAAGETLLNLRDPDLALEIARVAGETSTAQRQLEAIRTTRTTAAGQGVDPVERYRLSAQEEELKTRLANLAREGELLQSQRESLAVLSPLAGRVITWEVDERLAGRPVERGQVLVSVANTDGEWQLELQIPDDQMDAIRRAATNGEPVEVEYRLGSDTSQLHRATITDIAQRADIVQLPTGEETRSVVAHARPSGEIPAELREAALRPGGSVRARIVCGEHPVGYVWLRDAWRALRNWWEF
jgi:multidrug efflux pump subunit AcrA (membrane-fusion protein)